jgi:hypothetical protein
MAIVNFAAPILPGKLDAWHAMNASINGERKAAMDAMQASAGVKTQYAHLQQTPMGDFAIVFIEADDPGAFFGAMASGTDELTTWFRAQIGEIHGMDLTDPPAMPVLGYEYRG